MKDKILKTEEDKKIFAKALLNPAEPNEALKKAMKNYHSLFTSRIKLTKDQLNLLMSGNVDYISSENNPYMFLPFAYKLVDLDSRTVEPIHIFSEQLPKRIRYEIIKGLQDVIDKLKEKEKKENGQK